MVDFMVERRVMAYSSFDYLLRPSTTKLFAILLYVRKQDERKMKNTVPRIGGKVENGELANH